MNDADQQRLSDADYERMEWLETKEYRGVMTLGEKEELTSLQMRWGRINETTPTQKEERDV